jgi:hypothetical protein
LSQKSAPTRSLHGSLGQQIHTRHLMVGAAAYPAQLSAPSLAAALQQVHILACSLLPDTTCHSVCGCALFCMLTVCMLLRIVLPAAISSQFEAMTSQDPPAKGKNKVVSTRQELRLAVFVQSTSDSAPSLHHFHVWVRGDARTCLQGVRGQQVLTGHLLHAPCNTNSAPFLCTTCSPCAQYTVELTLEEIYHGCLKKVTHKRKVLQDNGDYFEEARTLTIDVKPGLPSGTRFVFEG